jgi:hypothetical protein
MEPEGLLLCSQEPATARCSEPNESVQIQNLNKLFVI